MRAQSCVLFGRFTQRQLTLYDRALGEIGCWEHRCWGPIDPAHVNETQARGAYDVGEIVPLCRGAHRMLDQVLGPAEFAQVTGLDLTHLAAGYPQAFVERGGTL